VTQKLLRVFSPITKQTVKAVQQDHCDAEEKEVTTTVPTYVALLKWTDEGRKAITNSLNRVERARNVYKQFGAEMKAFYYVFGRYDMVSIVEAPSDEAMAKAVLTAERWGVSRFETLKAFTEAEAAEIFNGVQ
jgi:uncharacterized protein with GYD domain